MTKNFKYRLATVAIAAAAGACAVTGQAARAQAEPPASVPTAVDRVTRFAQYIDAVEQHSLDLQSQRETINAARAGVSIAGVRPDPNLFFGVGPKELSSAVYPKPRLAKSLGLDWTIETGGKRDRRIKAAQSNVKLTEATVEGVKHELYTASATAFEQACQTREALVRQESSLEALSEMARVNEVRRKAGDLGGLELLQSRTERDQYQSAVVKARADAQAALVNLSVPLGQRFSDLFGTGALVCDFAAFAPGEDMDALIREALRERDDVQIARATLANARANVDLVRANRYVDPTVSLVYTRTPTGRNVFDGDGKQLPGTPQSKTLSLSVSIPIPFSRLQRGELVQAESAVTQAMLTLRQAELKTEADVHVNYLRFVAARDTVRRYRESLNVDSAKLLDGIRLSYRTGAASLLAVLAAQRSADDAYLAYLQAQADLAAATVSLQLSIRQRPAL